MARRPAKWLRRSRPPSSGNIFDEFWRPVPLRGRPLLFLEVEGRGGFADLKEQSQFGLFGWKRQLVQGIWVAEWVWGSLGGRVRVGSGLFAVGLEFEEKLHVAVELAMGGVGAAL